MKSKSATFHLVWSKLDLSLLGGASLFVVITRWLYHSRYLFHWDSAQFALALHGLDVVHHRPHPPGYLFYVYLAKLTKLLVGDDNAALIVVGIVASVAGLWLVYYLTAKLFKQKLAGWIAGALYVFSTTVAFHGMVAEVYIVEAIAALGVITLLYYFWQQPSRSALLWGALALGLLGGIRQTTELSLLPLFIYVVLSRRRPFKDWWLAGGLLVVANLLWLAPLATNSGGLMSYLASLHDLYRVVVTNNILKVGGWWAQIVENSRVIGQTLNVTAQWELVVGYLVLSPWLITQQLSRKSITDWGAIVFWLLALGGPLGLVLLTLMTNPGYLLLANILILMFISGGLVLLCLRLSSHIVKATFAKIWLGAVVGILAIHQVFLFYTLKPGDVSFISPSQPSISIHDDLLKSLLDRISEAGAPGQVAVWVESPQTMLFFDIRQLQYYLPGYDIYRQAPDSIRHNNNDPIWHANGMSEDFIPQVALSSNIKKLFIVRPLWNELHDIYQIPLKLTGDRYTVYYDLTQADTRTAVASKYGFSVW